MDPVEQAANVSKEEGQSHNDLASKIDAFSEKVDSKGMVDSKVIEVISLWDALHKSLHERGVENFIDLFDKLYLYSARLILQGSWYEATKNDNNNAQDYKHELLETLNGIIQDALSQYPAKVELCRSLKPLVESPWGLAHIKEILSYKGLKTASSSVDTLWEQENAVLLKVRIEYLCSAKMFDQAFALAHACYLKGYWTYDDPNPTHSNNVDNQYNVYTKELYFQFTDILYLLLCRLNSTAKYQDILSVPTALEVVERLATDSRKIAPKWKEWKKAHKTIVVAIAEFLTNQNQMQVDANALKSLFAHWIRCTSKSDEDEEIRPVKEVLSRISLIQTDYAYELANAILENFPSRPYAGIKFVEIYIRALNKDINQFQSLEVTENHDPELTKSFHQKLAQRYLRMADVFRASDNERSFQMMLTAFSLHPSESLYEHLFETNNNSDENNDIASRSEIVIENSSFYDKPIELTSDLKEDLQTVTTGCRLGSLCWEKERSELKRLCRQLIDSGGPIIKAKEDLTDLHIDYTTYEPPVDEPETINDYGFEKGYEPKDLENLFKKADLESRKNLTKVGKTIKQKSFQRNYNKRGRKPGQKFSRQTGSKYVNNYHLKKRTAQSSNDMIGSCDQQTFIGISKMRVRLGSRLKKVHVTYRKEIGGRSFAAPPDNLTIYATEFFRRMSSKEFALDGDCGARWKTIIKAPSFLAEGDDTSFDSLKEKLMTTTPVEDDFLSYLVDKPIYNHLKLKCNFRKQNLQPVVALQREIPFHLVRSVASTCALDRVVEALQESLKMLQHGIENPTKYSPTLSHALLQSAASDDQLNSPLNDPIIIPQIVQDVYNALPMHDGPSELMSNVPSSQPSCSNTTTSKAEPKSKMNQILFNRTYERMEKRRGVKSRALGLEISDGNVVNPTRQSLESLPAPAADSSVTPSNNFETDAVSSAHPPVTLSSLQSAKPMRMETFLLSQALYKLKILQSDNKISAPSPTTHSIPSENLESLSSDEHLKMIEHSATETAVDKEKVFTSGNESAIKVTTKSADINLEEQKIITDSVNSEVLEIAQLVYGNFITGDLRKEPVTTSESTTMEDISDSPESVQISDDEDFTMTPTNVEVQKQLVDSSGTRSKRRKTGHDATSFSPPPSPTTKGPKRTVARRNGHAINPPAVNNNSNEVTMNDIEVSPVPQLLFPPKMPEIIEESLENHALYHEGSMFLNDQTGWMEPVNNEQDLHFEEYEEPNNDTFWETWQDNFLSATDTEEQIEDEWRKQMPPADVDEEESLDVGDNRLNSYICSCPQTPLTTNEQYINIYQNPYESTSSNSASITNSPCKVHAVKDCQVSLTRLSEREIIGNMANSRESNEEMHMVKESVYGDNSKLSMEANNLLNSQYFDGQLNPINGGDDSDVESIELQKLPLHYPDLKANSGECNEGVLREDQEEENVDSDDSNLSIGGDDDTDANGVENSGETNEVVSIDKEENYDGDFKVFIEENNLPNSPCDETDDDLPHYVNGGDDSDVDDEDLQDWPLYYPDVNHLDDSDYNSAQEQQQKISRNGKRSATTVLQNFDDNSKKMRIEAEEELQTHNNVQEIDLSTDEQEDVEERDSPSKEIEVVELSSDDEEGEHESSVEEGEQESSVNHRLSYILITADVSNFDYDETDPAVSNEELMDTTENDDLSKNVSLFYADDEEEEENFIVT